MQFPPRHLTWILCLASPNTWKAQGDNWGHTPFRPKTYRLTSSSCLFNFFDFSFIYSIYFSSPPSLWSSGFPSLHFLSFPILFILLCLFKILLLFLLLIISFLLLLLFLNLIFLPFQYSDPYNSPGVQKLQSHYDSCFTAYVYFIFSVICQNYHFSLKYMYKLYNRICLDFLNQ